MNPFLTWQMLNPTPLNSWNLRMNVAWDDMIARNGFYQMWSTPTNWCFSPYMSAPTGNNYLLDLDYTWAQTTHQNGGQPLFNFNNLNYGNYDSFGNSSNYGGFNMGYPSQYGPNPYNFSNQSNSSAKESGNTAEDEEYKIKFNKLYPFMLEIQKSADSSDSNLSTGDIAKIKAAIKEADDSKLTYKEKFEKLEKAYNDVISNNKNVLKDFIINNEKMGIDGKSTGKDKSIKAELLKIGYEYENTEVDNKLIQLRDAIDRLDDADSESSTDADLIGGANKDNILDIISSWNSNEAYKENKVMTLIMRKYKSLKDPESKNTAKSNITQFASKLVEKANEEMGKLTDDELKAELKKAKKALEQGCGLNELTSDFDKQFDELYKLTRLAAAKNLASKVEKNDALKAVIDIVKNTKNDLANEGYDINNNTSKNNVSPDDSKIELINGYDPKEAGKTVGDWLDSHTSDAMSKEIPNYLEDLTIDNVYEFLDGYYEVTGKKRKEAGTHEGIIESLDDDDISNDDTKRVIKKNHKNKIITNIIELAKKHNVNTDVLEEIIKKHSQNYSSAENYGQIYKPTGWFKQNIKYNEAIDMEIQNLYEAIKAKRLAQAHR